MDPQLELIAKLIGGGGVAALALVVWWEQRSARREAREDRRELAALLERLGEGIARIDERTALLVGEMTPVEVPTPRPHRRERTPPRGVSTEYLYGRGRKPGDDPER